MNVCCLSMATSAPNPGVNQNTCCCCGDGGASNLSSVLNTIGRYGTAVTGIVAGSQVKGAQIKAGVAQSAINSTTMIVIVIALAIIVFFALR